LFLLRSLKYKQKRSPCFFRHLPLTLRMRCKQATGLLHIARAIKIHARYQAQGLQQAPQP
jgi:hypothetical protein